MRRARCGVALVATLFLAIFALVGVATAKPSPEAKAWTVIDARTGTVLDSHAAARRLSVASTTKMMTAYVAMKLAPLDRIVRAAPYEAGYGESLLGLRPGQRVSVGDLIYGLILSSGNDAAYTLAEALSGSQSAFVAAMNREVAALGLADTHFANPVGLDQSGNYSSARDLAKLAQVLLRDPQFARISNSRRAVLRSTRPPLKVETINDLLWMAPWATGVKTGHTSGAGWVLVGSGSKRGVDLISVAIGAPTESARYTDNLELLEWGFSLYQHRVPVRRGQDMADPEIRFSGGELPLRAARRVAVGLREGQQLWVKVRAPQEVEGPVARGAKLGVAEVFVDEKRVAKVPLRAGRSIAAASRFDKARVFILDNPAPVAIVVFVILMGMTVAIRRQSRRTNRGRGTG